MIKRSAGFFKIAFFVFCFCIALFLVLFSVTEIRNYATTEMCMLVFCLSITLIPLIVELIIYSLGVITKGIRITEKEETINFKPMKNSKVPYAALNDNGSEKMMFFSDKGKITIVTANNTKIHWSSNEDKMIIHSQFCECFSVYKVIYGTKYENFECDVYTTLPAPVDSSNEKVIKIPSNTEEQPAQQQMPLTPPTASTPPSTVNQNGSSFDTDNQIGSKEPPMFSTNVPTSHPQDMVSSPTPPVADYNVYAYNTQENRHNNVYVHSVEQEGQEPKGDNTALLPSEEQRATFVAPDYPIVTPPITPPVSYGNLNDFDYSIGENDTLFEETIKL